MSAINQKISQGETPAAWVYDLFGTSIATAAYVENCRDLSFRSTIQVQHIPLARQEPIEVPDQAKRLWSDGRGAACAWAVGVVAEAGGGDAYALQIAMTDATGAPARPDRSATPDGSPSRLSLALGSESARSLAPSMLQAARALCASAKDVANRLREESPVWRVGSFGLAVAQVRLRVFLPGPGWIALDPTHCLLGGRGVTPIAVGRSQGPLAALHGASPGQRGSLLTLDIEVKRSAAR